MKKILSMLFYSLLFFSIIVLDFFTKKWALKRLAEPIMVNSFLSCELTINRGISWGFFHYAPQPFYYILSMMIAFMILLLAFYTITRFLQGHSILFETMIIAGGCGNLLDRFLYGGVIDFILLAYGSYALPLFNIADAVIVGAAVCFALVHYRQA